MVHFEFTQNPLVTYNAPARKRRMIIEIVFTAKADENEKMNAPVAAKRRTFCLPQVSARKPHKWLVNTMPRYDIAERNPCSPIVNFKSHFAYGKIELILIFSMPDPKTLKPVRIIRIIWNFPFSNLK